MRPALLSQKGGLSLHCFSTAHPSVGSYSSQRTMSLSPRASRPFQSPQTPPTSPHRRSPSDILNREIPYFQPGWSPKAPISRTPQKRAPIALVPMTGGTDDTSLPSLSVVFKSTPHLIPSAVATTLALPYSPLSSPECSCRPMAAYKGPLRVEIGQLFALLSPLMAGYRQHPILMRAVVPLPFLPYEGILTLSSEKSLTTDVQCFRYARLVDPFEDPSRMTVVRSLCDPVTGQPVLPTREELNGLDLILVDSRPAPHVDTSVDRPIPGLVELVVGCSAIERWGSMFWWNLRPGSGAHLGLPDGWWNGGPVCSVLDYLRKSEGKA